MASIGKHWERHSKNIMCLGGCIWRRITSMIMDLPGLTPTGILSQEILCMIRECTALKISQKNLEKIMSVVISLRFL
jgi:hypothetical protein